MKKAIGGTYIYGLIIIFLLIMFGFLMACFSYNKAFRVSKSTLKIIESYGGYNKLSSKEIERYLDSIGYYKFKINKEDCPDKEKLVLDANNGICVYQVELTEKSITYGLVSYMTIDLPLVELIKIPIYGETEKIYIFG